MDESAPVRHAAAVSNQAREELDRLPLASRRQAQLVGEPPGSSSWHPQTMTDPLTTEPLSDQRTSSEIAADCVREIRSSEDMPSLQVIQRRGGAEEFAIAAQYCRSPNNAVREVGANILAQLGYEEGGTFIDESVEVLLPMLNDESGEVVRAVAIALGRRHHESTIPHLLAMVDHPHGDVRFGVVHGLMGYENLDAIQALIGLTQDPNREVREWAMFALGTQIEADTPEIRAAFTTGLADEYDNVRDEAIAGLVRCGAESALNALATELDRPSISMLNLRTAAELADPRLIPTLTRLVEPMSDDADFSASPIPPRPSSP